jgi:tetratricopeptide (TPR) repeat protein
VPEDRAFDGSVRTDLSTYLATVFALGGARVRDRAFIGSPRDARFDFEHLGASKLDLDRVLSMVRQDVHYHASDVEYRFSEEALQLFEAGDYAGAAKVCAELIAIDPLLARAGWLRAQCLAKLGKKAAAEQAARTVPVSAVGGLAELYDGAVITWKAGATEIAKRAIVSALASWPDDGDSWYLFGELLKSEPVRALPCFERAKELGVEDPDLDAAIVAAKARLAPKSRKHKG